MREDIPCSGLLVATALSLDKMSASCCGGYACRVCDIAFGTLTPGGGIFPSGRGGNKFVDLD